MRCSRGAIVLVVAWAVSSAVTGLAIGTTQQNSSELDPILDKATAYIERYLKRFTTIVSEERYEQQWTRIIERGLAPSIRQTEHRVLVSDFLMVQIPGSSEWTAFRDVYSVDGQPVRNRDDRLMKLLTQRTSATYDRVLEIRDESRRYNLGDHTCDINVPTFALSVLSQAGRAAFVFRKPRRVAVDGINAVEVDYAEVAKSTLVQGLDGARVPASGTFVLDPETGAVLRSVFEVKPEGMRTRIEVTYRYEPKLEMLLPAEMKERQELSGSVVSGRATYGRFRRFDVATDFEIKK